MKLVKMIAKCGRARSPFNESVLPLVARHTTAVTKLAPQVAGQVCSSNLAFHAEFEASTTAKIVRSVPRAARDDYGYDGGARAAYQAV